MPNKGSVAVRRARAVGIFPRFHQWDAVLKLEGDAAANSAGHSYLIQHPKGRDGTAERQPNRGSSVVSTGSTLGLPVSGLTHHWIAAPTAPGLAQTGAMCKSALVVGESGCQARLAPGCLRVPAARPTG